MQAEKTNGRDRLWELQGVISKLPLNVCTTTVLPEFGVRWKEVARAVRSYRLPMESASIGRVLCRYIAKTIPTEELDDILAKLKLHLVARQSRTWHVVHLHDPLHLEPAVQDLPATLLRRLHASLREYKPTMTAEVQSIMIDSLIYISIQMSSANKQGSPLYLATPPADSVALVSTAGQDKLLQAAVQGLGYSSFTRASLHGAHIPSLLRMADPAWGGAPAGLAGAEPYAPPAEPGKYTNQEYDREYVDQILGPDPPHLTSLHIKTTTDFFDKSLLNKSINLNFNLKSEDVATTLRSWVVKGAIAPNSEFINIFHKMKSNRLTFVKDDDDGSD